MENMEKLLEDLINAHLNALDDSETPWTIETETEQVKCTECGEMVDKDDCTEINGEWICNDCVSMYYVECTECGELIHKDYAIRYDYEWYCGECAEDTLDRCDDCGEYIGAYDGYWTHDGRHICDCCRDDNYYFCRDCDELYHTDEIIWDDDTDEPYCRYCYNERQRRPIQNYHYKPTPIFYHEKYTPDDDLFMGIELEIDRGGEDDDNAQILLDTMNSDKDHIYIKHDGSINNGFEIVSHPCTLGYHANEMKWEKLMENALRMGYRSHDTATCGLHVHVNRNFFGYTYDEQDKNISKVLYFVENNWNAILRFTRRKESDIDHWASRYGIERNVEETYKKAKGDWNRYRCINLQNEHTIEFRIFRGTLRHATFIATLQFVHALCNLSLSVGYADIEKMDWYTFTRTIDFENYPELRDYLNARNLY